MKGGMMYPPILFYNPMVPNLFKLGHCTEPPTIYSLLNSIVNFGKDEDEQVKIKDLANAGRSTFFDFDYPLATGLDKGEFECMILNHFMMRRIGYETVTAFKLALQVKLNEIMPMYNTLFESIKNWNLFTDGETYNRTKTDNRTTNASSTGNLSSTSDQRFSDTPQNQIQDVKDGSYVTEYNYNQDTSNSSGTNNVTDNNTTNETINKSNANKVSLYSEFLKSKRNLYTMIFEDLEPLFYQIVM